MNQADWVFQILTRIAAPIIHVILAFPSHRQNKLNDRMVEIKTHSNLTRSCTNLICLHLRDQLLERSSGEPVTLVYIQVYISCFNQGAQILLDERIPVVPLENKHWRLTQVT